jgi:hypothetical protein
MPEEVRPSVKTVSLSMPTPEQLGVAAVRPADAVDWASARQRLDRLGAACFQLEKSAPDGFRFVCLLPTAQSGRTHRIETRATTEAEAVRTALEQAEEWARGKK